jgi:hypothetical protein
MSEKSSVATERGLENLGAAWKKCTVSMNTMEKRLQQILIGGPATVIWTAGSSRCNFWF